MATTPEPRGTPPFDDDRHDDDFGDGRRDQRPRGERRRGLRRSSSERVIAGVCGGVAEFFDIDPVAVRVGFVLLALMSVGVPLYLIMWVVVPRDDQARTPAAPTPPWLVGTLVAMLVGIGALSALLSVDFAWMVFFPLMFLALVVLAVRRRSAGLWGLFALVLVAGIAVMTARTAVLYDSAFGDRSVVVTAPAELAPSYSHAFGRFDLDLSHVTLPEGTTEVHVRAAFGEADVHVPDGVALRVRTDLLFGRVEALAREQSGLTAGTAYVSDGWLEAGRRLDLTVEISFGQARITGPVTATRRLP